MYSRSRLCGLLLAAGAIAMAIAPARAVVLDWDAATWTNGNNGSPIPNNYDVDPTNPGTDLTITFSGQVSKLRADPTTGANSPGVMSTLHGGLSPVQNSLHVYASVGTHTEITLSVSFSASYVQGVENVSFTLFDIDKTTDSEFIKDIYGIRLDGTLVPATISGLGSAVGLSGSGLTQLLTGNAAVPDTGVNSGSGNATISFGSNVITGFAFTFDNSQGPPRVQEFSMHDINFTPVPEVNPAFGAAAGCLVAGWVRRRVRRSRGT